MKLVIDTNVWLDWLVFDDAGIAFLREGFESGRWQIVVDEACAAEFERVLAYPFSGHRVDAQACMARFRRIATRVPTLPVQERLPKCSDPDDQKFLELAAGTRADFLVTKDRALLDMGRRLTSQFRIVNPECFVTECKARG
jgi:uncharacterized protein